MQQSSSMSSSSSNRSETYRHKSQRTFQSGISSTSWMSSSQRHLTTRWRAEEHSMYLSNYLLSPKPWHYVFKGVYLSHSSFYVDVYRVFIWIWNHLQSLFNSVVFHFERITSDSVKLSLRMPLSQSAQAHIRKLAQLLLRTVCTQIYCWLHKCPVLQFPTNRIPQCCPIIQYHHHCPHWGCICFPFVSNLMGGYCLTRFSASPTSMNPQSQGPHLFSNHS